MKVVTCKHEFNFGFALFDYKKEDRSLRQLESTDFSWISQSRKTARLRLFVDTGNVIAYFRQDYLYHLSIKEMMEILTFPYVSGIYIGEEHAMNLYWKSEHDPLKNRYVVSKNIVFEILEKAREYVSGNCQTFKYWGEYGGDCLVLFKWAVRSYSKEDIKNGVQTVNILYAEAFNWASQIQDADEAAYAALCGKDTKFVYLWHEGDEH
ncbi:MAG: hypothetical protein QXL94_02750 [Candidatus Parvarchaeum sp.]